MVSIRANERDDGDLPLQSRPPRYPLKSLRSIFSEMMSRNSSRAGVMCSVVWLCVCGCVCVCVRACVCMCECTSLCAYSRVLIRASGLILSLNRSMSFIIL